MNHGMVGVCVGDRTRDVLRLMCQSFRKYPSGTSLTLEEVYEFLQIGKQVELVPYEDVVTPYTDGSDTIVVANGGDLNDVVMTGFSFHNTNISLRNCIEPSLHLISNIGETCDHSIGDPSKVDFTLGDAEELVNFAKQLKEQGRLKTSDDGVKLSLVHSVTP